MKARVYPNPISSSTTFEISCAFIDSHTTLEIFNIVGEKVVVLFDGKLKQGETRSLRFAPGELGDGLYFYRLSCGQDILNGRVIMLKD